MPHGPKPPDPRKADYVRKGGGDKCCPMAAAVRSVKEGKFRLARRYARMSVRLIVARLV